MVEYYGKRDGNRRVSDNTHTGCSVSVVGSMYVCMLYVVGTPYDAFCGGKNHFYIQEDI